VNAGGITYRVPTHSDLEWLEDQAHVSLARDGEGMVAEVNGQRAAVVVAERWSETAAWIHLAISDPKVCAGRALFRRVCDYVFEDGGRRYILSTTSSLNTRSLKLQQALGLAEIGRIPDGFGDGDDIVIMRLKATDWYAKRKH
jgi:L-amino acid N-acyltransferase YncA